MSATLDEALDALAARTLEVAVVARGLETRSEQATRAIERAAQDVDAAATRLAGVGERIGHDAARVVGAEAGAHARAAIADALADARTRLDDQVRRLQALDAAVAASTASLARAHRRWLIVAPTALIAACVLAVAGTAAWVAASRAEVERLRTDAATLGALASSEIVRCGDALCARIERNGAAPPGYRRVAKRTAP